MVRIRTPPGRSGRLWLRDRLALAERGSDLLERKLRLLLGERRRLRQIAEEGGRDWEEACARARTWSVRASMTGGQRALDLATGTGTAAVAVSYRSVMGVRYPYRADCSLPGPGPDSVIGASALHHAWESHRDAVDAAVRCAVAEAALRVVESEVEVTRVRTRALRRHWIPALRRELARVELALVEEEREEGVRRRWAGARVHEGGQA